MRVALQKVLADCGSFTMDGIPKPPRLITIVKIDSFPTFGFNLHGIKGKPGQVIRDVDGSGPAARSGLLPGDCILAVNGESVLGATHTMVVERIKSVPDRVVLLVCDEESKEHYDSKGIAITEESAIPMSSESGEAVEDEQTTEPADAVNEADEKPKKSNLISRIHSYGKKKVNKRDSVKMSDSWAEKTAAFDDL